MQPGELHSRPFPGADVAALVAGESALSVLVAGPAQSHWTDSSTTCVLSTGPTCLFTGHDDGSVAMWNWSASSVNSGEEQENDGVAPMTLTCVLQSASRFPVVALVRCSIPGRSSGSVASVHLDGTLDLFADNGSSFEACNIGLIVGVGEVRFAAAFREGRYLAVIGQSASILVLDLLTMSPTHLLHGHEDWVGTIAVKDDAAEESTLVSCGDDGMLHLWQWRGDSFASALKKCSIAFTGSSSPEELLDNSEDSLDNRKFQLSFGGSTLLVVGPRGQCGYLDTRHVQFENNSTLNCRSISANIRDARFLDKAKGSAIVALEMNGSVSLFNRVTRKTGEYSVLVYEFVTFVIGPSPTMGLSEPCAKCNRLCSRSLLIPLKGGGFALSRSLCYEERLETQIGTKKWAGHKLRYTASSSDGMQLIIPPASKYTFTTVTIVVGETVPGNLSLAILPETPVVLEGLKKKPKVTAMKCFSSWTWDHGTTRVLLIGRLNGKMDLFRLTVPQLQDVDQMPKLEKLQTIQAHKSAITGFSYPGPSKTFIESGNQLFCSIGADNDVVVFELCRQSESEFQVSCLFRFSGHHSGVRSVYWDTGASTLHIKCDKTFVWSLVSGCLERRTANTLDFSFQQASRSSYSTGAVLFAHTPTSLLAGCFENEIDPLGKSSAIRCFETSEEAIRPFKRVQSIEFPSFQPSPKSSMATVFDFDVKDVGEMMKLCLENNLGHKCGRMLSGAISLLHDWGMDPQLDELCRAHFGMIHPGMAVRYCQKQTFTKPGFGGTVHGCTTMIVSTKRWNMSEYLTASQNLGLVVLFLNATTFQSIPVQVSDTLSQLVTAYGIKFPDILRKRHEWKEPSLTFLAKRAMVLERKEDISSGNHIAARLLLQRTIERMSTSQRTLLVQEWSNRLSQLRETFQVQVAAMIASTLNAPSQSASPVLLRANNLKPAIASSARHSLTPSVSISSKKVSTNELSSLESESFIVEEEQPMDERLRSMLLTNKEYQLLVLLLSMVGVVHPADIAPVTARLVTETLVEILSVREKHVVTTSSSTMQNHPSSNSVPSNPSPVAEITRAHTPTFQISSSEEAVAINPAFAAELLAKGFPLFRPHIPHMSRIIRQLLHLANDSGDYPQRSTAADRALSEVGSAHPVLFIRTIGAEVCKREASDSYRRKGLEVLVTLVKAFPILFLRHLPLVAEVVIKTLDPSEPTIRNSCLTASTVALQELVKRYPMVAFHQSSQRFAVGTVESTIIIYDLRTATKWRVLDGTVGPVSSVAFEKDGERMASYGAHECSIRIWATRSPGLFGGLLTIRGTFLMSIRLPPVQGPPPSESTILKECRLEWTSPAEVKLRREGGGTSETYKLPET